MKAKKALKRLTRVEELLAEVLEGLAAIEQHARELLDSAKASVVRAKKAMKQKAASADARKRAVERKRPIRTGPVRKRRKKPAPSVKNRGVRAKAARTIAKKPTVMKAKEPKRLRLAAESKKRTALGHKKRRVGEKAARSTAKKQPGIAAKKRAAKLRRPIQARKVQQHLAKSTRPMPSLSSTPKGPSDTVETNIAPLPATEGSEPVKQG
jgi:hypothetical protein